MLFYLACFVLISLGIVFSFQVLTLNYYPHSNFNNSLEQTNRKLLPNKYSALLDQYYQLCLNIIPISFLNHIKINSNDQSHSLYKIRIILIVILLSLTFISLILNQYLICSVLTLINLLIIYALKYFLKYKHNHEIKSNLIYIIKCFQILAIENTLSVEQSLQILEQSLPKKYFWLKLEFKNLNLAIKSQNLNRALTGWQTDITYFRQFLDLCQHTHTSFDKQYINLQALDLIESLNIENQNFIKDRLDKVQLYYLVPTILMMLISVVPLIFFIKKLLKGQIL